MARKFFDGLSKGPFKNDWISETATLSQCPRQRPADSVTVCRFLTKSEGPITGSKVCWSGIQRTFENCMHPWYSNKISMIKSLALSFCYSTMVQSLARKSVGRLSNGRLKFECTPDTATISQIWGHWLSVSVTVCWFLTDKVDRLSGSKVCCSAKQWTFQNRLHAA